MAALDPRLCVGVSHLNEKISSDPLMKVSSTIYVHRVRFN